jgi:hypothetical protein
MTQDRLYVFFYADTHARTACSLWSIGFAAVASAIGVSVFDASTAIAVAGIASVACTLSFSYFLWRYVARMPSILTHPELIPWWKRHLVLTATTVTVVVFAVAEYTISFKIGGDVGSIPLSTLTKLVASTPTKKTSQVVAAKIIQEAKKSAKPLPVELVEQAGDAFIGAAKESPAAWNVALDFAAYKTELNSAPAPEGRLEPMPPPFPLFRVNGKPYPDFAIDLGNPLPFKESARFEMISRIIVQRPKTGPAWIFAVGGALDLNGLDLRRVIFRNTELHYSGSALIMENVFFINCTFIFDNVPSGRFLGQQILASSPVNYRKTG